MTESKTDLEVQITRLLEHFKIRPTVVVMNTIYITLKNHGYKDIPNVQFTEPGSNILDRKTILKYCNEIEMLIKNDPDKEISKKKNFSKEIHIFPESSVLPQNVYVSEKGDEEKLEDYYVEEAITTASETEDSVISELEEQEEGYEIYEEDDSDEFSE